MKARLRYPLVWVPCFDSSLNSYIQVFTEWAAISELYSGWTLSEIKDMSPRERGNWIELAKAKYGRS